MKYFLTKIGIYSLWCSVGVMAGHNDGLFSWSLLAMISLAAAGFVWYDPTWSRYR